MKTAISVPDRTFKRATNRAGELGMSRSEFFARAVERYLDELDAESLTMHIDAALEKLGGPDPQTPDPETRDAVQAGRDLLLSVDDEW